MRMPRDLFLPGQLWQRLLAALLVPLAIWRVADWWLHDGSSWFAVVCGIVAFAMFALAIPPLYSAWIRFGNRLGRVATTVIFGAIYFLFVPFLLIFVIPKNRLRTRKADQIESFWDAQTERNEEIREMMRMG